MAKFPNLTPPDGGKGGKADPGGRKLEGKLAGIFKRNPTVALGTAGVAAVVVLAIVMRNRGGSSTSNQPGTVPSDQLQTFGGISGLYDSTANDVYNSVADQFQKLQQQLQELQDKVNAKPPTTTPPTTTPPKTTPPKTTKTVERPGGPLVKLPHGPVVGSIEYGVYQ